MTNSRGEHLSTFAVLTAQPLWGDLARVGVVHDMTLNDELDFALNILSETEDCTVGQPYYRHKIDENTAFDSLGMDMLNPDTLIRRVFIPNDKGKMILNWDNLADYISSMHYTVRPSVSGEDYDIFRYDTKSGYYVPMTADALTLQVNTAIVRNAPAGAVLPSNFAQMFKINIIPRISPIPDGKHFYEIQDLAQYYNGELLPFKNGIYSLRYNKLLPKTEYFFIEHPLNVNFNVSALLHEISERYLEIMCGNKMLFEDLFEQVGYAMYARSFTVPRFTIFTNSSGSNGKSIVIDAITRIIGSKNISTASMFDLSNKFAIASTEGRLINISSDSSQGIKDNKNATSSSSEFIKKATSGELYTFDGKNKKIHEGYGPRKFIFATNVDIRFDSADGGLMRRMGVIPFNNYFKEDRIMAARFAEEGATEWFAMQSLVSFICFIKRGMDEAGADMFSDTVLTGKFMVTESSKDAKIIQLTTQNNIYEWLVNDIDIDPTDKNAVHDAILSIPNDAWIDYRGYIYNNDGIPCRRDSFNRFIRQFGLICNVKKNHGNRTYSIIEDPNYKR